LAVNKEAIRDFDPVHPHQVVTAPGDFDPGRTNTGIGPVDYPAQMASLGKHIHGVVVTVDKTGREVGPGTVANLYGAFPQILVCRPVRQAQQ